MSASIEISPQNMHMEHCIVTLESIITQFKWSLHVFPTSFLNYTSLSLVFEKSYMAFLLAKALWNVILPKDGKQYFVARHIVAPTLNPITAEVLTIQCIFHNMTCCEVLFILHSDNNMIILSKIPTLIKIISMHPEYGCNLYIQISI